MNKSMEQQSKFMHLNGTNVLECIFSIHPVLGISWDGWKQGSARGRNGWDQCQEE